MYTVLRFSGDNEVAIKSIILALEKHNKSLFTGMDHDKDRFSCSISGASDQIQHWEEVLSTLAEIGPVFKLSKELGVQLQLDVGVENEDFGAMYAEIEPNQNVLSLIINYGIDLRFTIYKEQI